MKVLRYLIAGIALWANSAWATPVYLCETPAGHILVARFFDEGPTALAARAHLATANVCWEADDRLLPPRNRPDPRSPADQLTQRHRWRRGPGNTIVVDPSVRRPHEHAIARELGRLFPPGRLAQIVATPLGNNLMRAIRGQDWPLTRALLQQARSQIGTAQQILTQAELDEIGRIGDDYEGDLR